MTKILRKSAIAGAYPLREQPLAATAAQAVLAPAVHSPARISTPTLAAAGEVARHYAEREDRRSMARRSSSRPLPPHR